MLKPVNFVAGLAVISIAGEFPVIAPAALPVKASALILNPSTVTVAVGIAPTEASKEYSLIKPLPIATTVFVPAGGVEDVVPTTSSPS